MNNFFINICVRAFTNIDKLLQENRNQGQDKRNEKFKRMLEKKQNRWDKQILEAYKESCDYYFDLVNQHVEQAPSGSSFRSSLSDTIGGSRASSSAR